MITLQIQSLLDEKAISIEKLSELSGITEETIQYYSKNAIVITIEAAADLRKVASVLNVSVIDLIASVAQRKALQLKILELTTQKGWTLKELSERSGVDELVLAFYSYEPICTQKLSKSLHQENLVKISQALNCKTTDLQDEVEMPPAAKNIEDIIQEKGINLSELGLLVDRPAALLDLIDSRTVSINSQPRIKKISEIIERDFDCEACCLAKSLHVVNSCPSRCNC